MSENSNKNQQYPFMYIVQPDITLPESDMQEQLRVKLESSDQEVDIGEVNPVSDEIRIVSTESLKDKAEKKEEEVNMSEIRVKEEEEVIQLVEKSEIEETRAVEEDEIQVISETDLEVQNSSSLPETEVDIEESQHAPLEANDYSDVNVDTEHEEVIVEMNTSISTEKPKKESKVKSVSSEDSSKRVNKVIKKKKFSDMTKEELITFLAKMPPAVPKPLCNIVIRGKKMRGYIQRKKGELYYLKTLHARNNDMITFKMNEVEHIEVENL